MRRQCKELKLQTGSRRRSYSASKSPSPPLVRRSVSCRERRWRAISITQPAMLEQWSEMRSRLVSRSDQTKPASALHSPLCHAQDVARAHLLLQLVDDLLQRLDLRGQRARRLRANAWTRQVSVSPRRHASARRSSASAPRRERELLVRAAPRRIRECSRRGRQCARNRRCT